MVPNGCAFLSTSEIVKIFRLGEEQKPNFGHQNNNNKKINSRTKQNPKGCYNYMLHDIPPSARTQYISKKMFTLALQQRLSKVLLWFDPDDMPFINCD